MATTAPKKFRFPKSLGACADRLYELRELRLKTQKEMQAAVSDLDAEEKALKEHIINTLPKSEASGVAGKVARVTLKKKDVPQVEDWPKLYAHIKKTSSFNLLNRALSTAAVQELWDDGKKVPGVVPFTVVSLSINKL